MVYYQYMKQWVLKFRLGTYVPPPPPCTPPQILRRPEE